MSAVAAELTCSKQNVGRWSWRWHWEERVTAFDIYQDELHRAEMSRARTDMNKRHLKLGILMQSIGAHALAELQQRVEQKLPLGLSADEARALMSEGAKMERSAHGPEREHGRFTEIHVHYATKFDDPDPDDGPPLLEGKIPGKVN
jgi:hypothetical protein